MRQIVKLHDTYDEEDTIYVVESDKGTFEDFKKIYEEARNEWYERDNINDTNCLIEHIENRCAEKGYELKYFDHEIPQLDF